MFKRELSRRSFVESWLIGTAAMAWPQYAAAASLTPSGPVQASANGQVIEGLDITATGTALGVRVNGFSGVTVRGCRIRHASGRGILAISAPSLRIEDVDIICTGAPAAGPNPNSNMNNIELQNCGNAIVQRARCRNGSSGIYVVTSGAVQLRFIEGYNFRGPFPRGQVVQFNRCTAPVLEDFSCENQGNVAWTEDNVNFYGCTNPTCRRGFIRGNNSPSGQGVIVENGTGGSGGLIEDVDVVYWGNGAFMANGGSSGVKFWRCRARDGIDNAPNNSVGKPDYQGAATPDWATFVGSLKRGLPSSGSEAFFAYQTAQRNIEYHQCQYFNLPRSGVAWDQSRMSVREFAKVNFAPRAPIRLVMPWETSS
jgi:hypothetical protein